MSKLTDASGGWITPGPSSGNGNCVEASEQLDAVLVRDSKDRTGPVLSFTRGEWTAFVSGVKDGEFDLA